MLNTQKKINKLFLRRSKKRLLLVVVFCLLFFPSLIFAQIEITEIMYDLEIGGDTGREWIEIYNSGTEDIDLSQLKLYEAETNHKIKSIIEDGNTILIGGGYAILVDNPEKFFEDWSNFSGLVLDTAFSLKNTGELLTIRNADLVDIDSVNYLSDWGANGDGNSLQKINNDWVASSVTLGLANSVIEDIEDDNSGDEGEGEETVLENPVNTSSGSSFSDFIEINIKAKIKSLEYLPVAGADFIFEGESLGLENKALTNAIYQWSFGDGAKGKGQNILHSYSHPGEYMVVLEVISGEYSTCDKLKVKVISSEIVISGINRGLNDNFIELYNSSDYDLNLSWWRLKSDDVFFTFPKNTILFSKNYLKLPSSITKLLPRENSVVQLLYPSGMIAFDFSKKNEKNLQMGTTSFIKKEPEIVKKVPVVYSVEKPLESFVAEAVEDKKIKEASLNNQIAMINKSGEIGPIQAVKVKEDKQKDGFKFPINKWSFMLGGIILVAVAGVGYATKLDLENE